MQRFDVMTYILVLFTFLHCSQPRPGGIRVDGADLILAELRKSAVPRDLKRILAAYPRFLDPDEQDTLVELLVKEGNKNKIDPMLLAAVILVESAFSSYAVSNKGARGLMQLMPATGAEMSKKLGIKWRGPISLHDPKTNVKLGAYYLRWLLDHYDGSLRKALTAYNRGPKAVRKIKSVYGILPYKKTDYYRKIRDSYSKFLRKSSLIVRVVSYQ